MIKHKTHIKHHIQSLRYLNFNKVINLIKLYFTFISTKKELKFGDKLQPYFISVEPDNFCQLKCPECPVGQRTLTNKTFINEITYKKIIDELKNKLIHVIFYFQGEPLLNKNIADLIQYAHKNKIYTSTSTNAQILDSILAKKIVASGLDKLIVSIDGSTQEIYEKYRIGGSLNKAIEGIKHIQYWKTKLKSNTPLLEVQFVVFKHNEHQIVEMKTLARDLNADSLKIKTAQLYNFENGHSLLTSIDKYARYRRLNNGKLEIKNKLKNSCWRQWSGAVVNANSNLIPCCFDKNSEHSFGNLQYNSFLSIWHNKKASDFRAAILQNRKQFDMCKNCTSK